MRNDWLLFLYTHMAWQVYSVLPYKVVIYCAYKLRFVQVEVWLFLRDYFKQIVMSIVQTWYVMLIRVFSESVAMLRMILVWVWSSERLAFKMKISCHSHEQIEKVTCCFPNLPPGGSICKCQFEVPWGMF